MDKIPIKIIGFIEEKAKEKLMVLEEEQFKLEIT